MPEQPVIWLKEHLTPHDVYAHGVTRILVDEHTPYQHMQIVETPTYGRALILDDHWQSSTADEFFYHEPLVHGTFVQHALAASTDRGGPRSVLIAGGGDWAAARDALSWNTVERVVLAEIDRRVLDACREHFPGFHAKCEDDPRLEVIVGDAFETIDRAAADPAAAFDVILYDLSDPIEDGPSAHLFTKATFERTKKALAPGGVLAVQAGGVAPAEMHTHLAVHAALRSVFPRVLPLITSVPIFATPLGFLLASDAPITASPEPERTNAILRQAGVDGLRMLDGRSLLASLQPPVYLREAAIHAPRAV